MLFGILIKVGGKFGGLALESAMTRQGYSHLASKISGVAFEASVTAPVVSAEVTFSDT